MTWTNRIGAGVGAYLLLASPATAASTANYPELFDQVWQTVEQNFYDPTFRGVDWRSVGERHRAGLGAVRDDRAFLALTNQMLAELKVSHIRLAPPRDSGARLVGVGVTVKPIDGAPTIVDVAPLSDARQAGLRVGDQLVGPQEALYGAPGSAAHLRVRRCDDRLASVQVQRGAQLFPPQHPGWSWSRFSRGPGRTLGYLRIDRFDDGAAELADQAMSELMGADGLIIDLRRNSGGNISALRLASYFMPPGEAPAVAMFSRAHLQRLGRNVAAADVAAAPRVAGAYTDAAVFQAVAAHGGVVSFYTDDLNGRRYARPVVVLVGDDTASAAEGFAWAMRLRGKARFVGGRSAGELLSGEDFALHGGWTLTVPVHGVWSADGRDLGDQPIIPDVDVRWTRRDVCSGADPDVQRAIELLLEGATSAAGGP